MVVERGYFEPPVEISKARLCDVIAEIGSDEPKYNVRKRTLPVGTHNITPVGLEGIQTSEVTVFQDGSALVKNTFIVPGLVYADGNEFCEYIIPDESNGFVISADADDSSKELVVGYLLYSPGESPME